MCHLLNWSLKDHIWSFLLLRLLSLDRIEFKPFLFNEKIMVIYINCFCNIWNIAYFCIVFRCNWTSTTVQHLKTLMEIHNAEMIMEWNIQPYCLKSRNIVDRFYSLENQQDYRSKWIYFYFFTHSLLFCQIDKVSCLPFHMDNICQLLMLSSIHKVFFCKLECYMVNHRYICPYFSQSCQEYFYILSYQN